MKKGVFIVILIVSCVLVAGFANVRASSNPNGDPFKALWDSVYALQAKCTNNMTDYVLTSTYNTKVADLQAQITTSQTQIASLQTTINGLEARIAVLENLQGICTNGQTKDCGSNAGECKFGAQTCSNGAWGACVGGTGPTTEVCDGKDNNCNGQTDEGVMNTYYRDADGDGYGTSAITTQACSAPIGYVSNSNDCNDADSSVHPGATEVCNGLDDNCNGLVDDGVASQSCGYNNVGACHLGTQTCSNGAWGACIGAILPSAEICDGIDNDCNGMTDEGDNMCLEAPQAGTYCQAGTCKLNCQAGWYDFDGIFTNGCEHNGLKNQGDACSYGWTCNTGKCVDGYCCNSACTGECNRCDVAGSVGTCTILPTNSPGTPSCSPYSCDGVNAVCPTS
jgi:hypothetical protein